MGILAPQHSLRGITCRNVLPWSQALAPLVGIVMAATGCGPPLAPSAQRVALPLGTRDRVCPDSPRVVTGRGTGLRIIDLPSGSQVRHAVFSRDARSLAFLVDAVVYVVAVSSGEILRRHPGLVVSSLAISPNGDAVAIGTSRDRICVLDVASGQVTVLHPGGPGLSVDDEAIDLGSGIVETFLHPGEPYSKDVAFLQFSRDGMSIFSTTSVHQDPRSRSISRLRVWDRRSGKLTAASEDAFPCPVWDFLPLAGDRMLVSLFHRDEPHWNELVIFRELGAPQVECRFRGDDPVASADGRRIAYCADAGEIRIRSAETTTELSVPAAKLSSVGSVLQEILAFSSDGSRLAWESFYFHNDHLGLRRVRAEVHVSDLRNGQCESVLTFEPQLSSAATFDPDGDTLYVVSPWQKILIHVPCGPRARAK